MIVRLAMRTIAAHPIRTAVLAAGFGTGVSVMAILLGIAQVVLEQARSPVLEGGGDVVISSLLGQVTAARLLTGGALASPPLAGRTLAVSPASRSTLYLVRDGTTYTVKVRGGIPSRERALGDPEVAGAAAWVDAPTDQAWTSPDPGEVLRAIDRFHPVPDVPERAASWAEWLYFNGRSSDARFYLTFLAGPAQPDGTRVAGVRLQLERNGRMESFSASAALDDAAVAQAPDLAIGGNHVRLAGLRYTISLDLHGSGGRRAVGELFIEGEPGRQMAPLEIRGARGWRSGYVVPVMSGSLGGSLVVDGQRVNLAGGTGYHDHNWGFWEGVSWQWGQVRQDDISIVFGRVFPPRDAADPDRIPGFLAVIGPSGPLGYAMRVTIEETNAAGTSQPDHITVRGQSNTIDLTLHFSVEGLETSRMQGPMANSMEFLQLRGRYVVGGTVGSRTLKFESPGSAETFRGQ